MSMPLGSVCRVSQWNRWTKGYQNGESAEFGGQGMNAQHQSLFVVKGSITLVKAKAVRSLSCKTSIIQDIGVVGLAGICQCLNG